MGKIEVRVFNMQGSFWLRRILPVYAIKFCLSNMLRYVT